MAGSSHHQDHLPCRWWGAAGYRVINQTEEVLRYEYGQPVIGWVMKVGAA